jgi:inosine-uridine nucleoside N-ribohydrolase
MKALFFVILISFSTFSYGKADPVIFDTDTAYFADDAMALAMLLQHEEKFSIKGITITIGNLHPLQGVEFMTHILSTMKAHVPVYLGANKPIVNDSERVQIMKRDFGLGFAGAFDLKPPTPENKIPPYGGKFSAIKPQKISAKEFITDLLSSSKEPITFVAIGPLTNLAQVLIERPELVKKIKRLIFMGGNVFVPGNVTAAAEFNFWFDPEAASIVLRSAIPHKIMIGLDLTNQAVILKKHFDEISSLNGPLAEMFAYDLGNNFPGFYANPGSIHYIWDALVSAYLIDPSIIDNSEKLSLDVITTFGKDYGGVKVVPSSKEVMPVEVLRKLNFDRFYYVLKSSMKWKKN